METTHLIQRLTKPLGGPFGGRNPFSFGAGGGRLSNEALNLLTPIMNFDYMGAAEYEFGAVPEGLNKIYQNAVINNLFFSVVNIKTKDVKLKAWDDREKLRSWDSCDVYVIGPHSAQEEIERRVKLLATNENACLADHQRGKKNKTDGMYLRDGVNLDRYIKFEPQYDRVPIGWLELDNGFFFSVSKEMAEGFGKLFNVKLEG